MLTASCTGLLTLLCFLQSSCQGAVFLVHEAKQLPLASVLQSVQSSCLISSCILFSLSTMCAEGQDSFKPKYILSIQSSHEKQNSISWSSTVRILWLSTASLRLLLPMQQLARGKWRALEQHRPCLSGPPAQAACTLRQGAVQTIRHHNYTFLPEQRSRLLLHAFAGRARFITSLSAYNIWLP